MLLFVLSLISWRMCLSKNTYIAKNKDWKYALEMLLFVREKNVY